MDRWIKYNPNPKQRRVGDCAIRACCKATGRSWDDVYDSLSAIAKHKKDIISANDVWDDYIEMYGYERISLPPYRVNVIDFCEEHPKGDYVLGLDEHVVAVSDGHYYDTWDSGGKEVLRCWCRERLSKRIPQEMRDFIFEIIGVYNKYGLSISHEDKGGSFTIQKFDRGNVEWLKDAYKDY